MNRILVAIIFLFSSFVFAQEEHRVKGLLDGLGLDSQVSKEELNYTCDPVPPPKPPAQHSSAEGVPPLPLPVVPLRRTEKKNPPRPPVLVIKIVTDDEGDWATNPNDIENLLKWMAKEFGVSFSSQNRRLESVLGVRESKELQCAEVQSKAPLNEK